MNLFHAKVEISDGELTARCLPRKRITTLPTGVLTALQSW
jgi:hypothetical protein